MKNYDPSELHIIYIPDEYYKNQLNKVAQQEQIINEFIISELDKGKEENTTILPVEVVYSNESGIRSIRNTRPYVFFEKTNNNKKKEKGNKEIKDYTDTPDNIIALIKKLGLDLEADSQNVKRILNNFESSAAKKKLPLDFSKDLMRIGLALSSFGDIHTGLIMRFLRSHGQSRRDTMILDLLIQMSNFLVKKKAKGNFIDKFTEFAENYSSINIKDLFHLFYIYHISVITNNPQIFDKKQHEKTLEDAKLLLDRQEKEVSKK